MAKDRLVIEGPPEALKLIREEAKLLNISYNQLVLNIIVREILNRRKLREK